MVRGGRANEKAGVDLPGVNFLPSGRIGSVREKVLVMIEMHKI